MFCRQGGNIMRNTTKIWLVIASALVIFGGLIFTIAMDAQHWNFKELSRSKYTTRTLEITEEFSNITLTTSEADIKFVPSTDGTSKITYFDKEEISYTATVADGTIQIQSLDEDKWYYSFFNFKKPYITISIPASAYGDLKINSDTSDVYIPTNFSFENMDITLSTGDLNSNANVNNLAKIKTSTGDIELENISASTLDLTVTTGDISIKNTTCSGDIKIVVDTGESELNNVKCKSLSSTGDTGDIELEDFIATEKISIERDTGDVQFERSDATELHITTSTGDVKGSLLSDKVFITKSSSGKIIVPKTTTGGICEISTSTGDIKLWIYQ